MTRPINVVNKTEKQAAPYNKRLNETDSQNWGLCITDYNVAINQYKNVKSTLKTPHNLINFLTSRCVFKMEQLI